MLRNLQSKWIQPYLSDQLKEWVLSATNEKINTIEVLFGPPIIPFKATFLVDICKAYILANNDKALLESQMRIYYRLITLMTAFAKAGIDAMVDEITGYQDDIRNDKIQKMLKLYISEEFLEWTKIFPEEFYEQIFRFICANGLVLADSVFETYKIKHLGERDNDVANAVNQITAIKDKLMNKINTLSNIKLSQLEKESFAKLSVPLRFEEHLEINHTDLLTPLRDEDYKDDLYTTLNVIQENLIRGNISGINKESGRRFTSKEIKAISTDTHINKGLWDIAEKIAFIKEPNYKIAA